MIRILPFLGILLLSLNAANAKKYMSSQWYQRLEDPEFLKLNYQEWSTPAGSYDSTSVYAATSRGTLAKIDRKKGTILKQIKLKKGVLSELLLLSEGLVVGDYDGKVSLLDSSTFKLKWQSDINRAAVGKITEKNGFLFLFNLEGTLFKISLSDGKIVWQFSTSSEPELSFFGQSPPLFLEDNLCFATNFGGLRCVDQENGLLRAAYYPKQKLSLKDSDAGLIMWNKNIYYASYDSGLMIFNKKLKLQKKLFPKLKNIHTATLLKPFLYLTSADGRVLKINLETEKILWHRQLEKAPLSAVLPMKKDHRTGIAYLIGQKSLYAMDLFNGAIIDRFSLYYGASLRPLQLSEEANSLYLLSNKAGVFKINYGR